MLDFRICEVESCALPNHSDHKSERCGATTVAFGSHLGIRAEIATLFLFPAEARTRLEWTT
jgi:hypothetical protein